MLECYLPAIIKANGTKEWYYNNYRHRDGDQPAIIKADGTRKWCQKGFYYRDGNKPTIIFPDGTEKYKTPAKIYMVCGVAGDDRYYPYEFYGYDNIHL